MNPSSGSHNCRPDYPFNDPVTNSQNCRPLCASNHPVITFPSVGIIMTNSAHLMYAKPSTYACPFTRFLLNGPLYKLEPSNVSTAVPLDLFTSNTLCSLHQPNVLLQALPLVIRVFNKNQEFYLIGHFVKSIKNHKNWFKSYRFSFK